MLSSNKIKPVVLIFQGIFILWGFGWDTVGRRLALEADGKETELWAGATDVSLARSMPVGTRILKRRWRLDYERDGRQVPFPVFFYAASLGISLRLLVWGISLFLSQRKDARTVKEKAAGIE